MLLLALLLLVLAPLRPLVMLPPLTVADSRSVSSVNSESCKFSGMSNSYKYLSTYLLIYVHIQRKPGNSAKTDGWNTVFSCLLPAWLTSFDVWGSLRVRRAKLYGFLPWPYEFWFRLLNLCLVSGKLKINVTKELGDRFLPLPTHTIWDLRFEILELISKRFPSPPNSRHASHYRTHTRRNLW